MAKWTPWYLKQPLLRLLLRSLAVAWLIWAGLSACSNDENSSVGDNDEAGASVAANQVTIVALGDSLTAGLGLDETEAYPAVLERRLRADGYAVQVINAGISGETSSGAVSRLDWVVSALEPDLVILETGANDGLRGIDPKILSDNLDHLITTLKAAEIKVILAGMQMLPNLGPAYTRQFNAVFARMANAHDVPLIPFFLEGVAGDRRYNQKDMLHPNAEGYKRIVEHIYPWVTAALE